jgi:hypothetical protein
MDSVKMSERVDQRQPRLCVSCCHLNISIEYAFGHNTFSTNPSNVLY